MSDDDGSAATEEAEESATEDRDGSEEGAPAEEQSAPETDEATAASEADEESAGAEPDEGGSSSEGETPGSGEPGSGESEPGEHASGESASSGSAPSESASGREEPAPGDGGGDVDHEVADDAEVIGDSEVLEGDEAPRDQGTSSIGDDLTERIAAHDEGLAEEVALLVAKAFELKERVEELEEENEDLTGRLKRKQADFQNYKKRQDREKQRIRERATEDLVERLLDVRDNLKRAVEDETDDLESVRQGVEMTLKEFDRVLDDENVVEISPDPGDEVDPQRHEVMLRVESDRADGEIVEVYAPGYEMAGKVLKAAQVTVSEGSPDGTDAATGETDAGPEDETDEPAEAGSATPQDDAGPSSADDAGASAESDAGDESETGDDGGDGATRASDVDSVDQLFGDADDRGDADDGAAGGADDAPDRDEPIAAQPVDEDDVVDERDAGDAS